MNVNWAKPVAEHAYRRPEFWAAPPWDFQYNPQPPAIYQFPAADLMDSVIDLYFTHFGHYWPILHEPTFRKSYRSRLYEEDTRFGGLLLVVCTLGARFSEDPRCRWNGELRSAGVCCLSSYRSTELHI